MNIFSNFKYKFLALVLAIIFWIIVISLEDTVIKLDALVPIQPFNLSEQYSLVDPLGGAILYVRTNPEIAPNLTTSDFEVYVDLSGMEIGSRQVPVSITSKNSEVSILSVEPEEIAVTLEAVSNKTIPIQANITGTPSPGYDYGTPEIDLTNIKISGAESVLSKVDTVQAVIVLEGKEISNFTRRASLQAVDTDGNKVENITLSNTDVNMMVPVYQVAEKRTVSVRPTFINVPANSWVTDIRIEPSTIIVKGERNILSSIQYIETGDINASVLTEEEVTVSVNLKVIEGIELIDTTQSSVLISFAVKPIPFEKKLEADVKLYSIPETDYLITPTKVTLTLQGDSKIINSLKPADYYLVLDLSSYKETAEIELTKDMIVVPEGVTVKNIYPAKINYQLP